VFYRRIDRDRPTWLLDEAKILQIRGDNGQQLLALFDAGYKRGAVVSRCQEHGDGIRDFQVFCPKILARIGSFRGTLLDRGIPLHLEKARHLRQKRRSVLAKEAAPLKERLEAYALQNRARLEDLYRAEPDEGYWPRIFGRDEEIWGPLLIHARLISADIEKRAVAAAVRYSMQKADIAISEDRILALAQEALEVLRALRGEEFGPKDIVQELGEKESWGEYLAERKTDKARVTAIGTFFSQFRVASRRHTDTGSRYGRPDVISALERHMPRAATPAEGVSVSVVIPTDLKSTDCAADTSEGEASFSQSPDNKELITAADTMTPQPAGGVWIEEDL
jgi:hypothetical protein